MRHSSLKLALAGAFALALALPASAGTLGSVTSGVTNAVGGVVSGVTNGVTGGGGPSLGSPGGASGGIASLGSPGGYMGGGPKDPPSKGGDFTYINKIYKNFSYNHVKIIYHVLSDNDISFFKNSFNNWKILSDNNCNGVGNCNTIVIACNINSCNKYVFVYKKTVYNKTIIVKQNHPDFYHRKPGKEYAGGGGGGPDVCSSWKEQMAGQRVNDPEAYVSSYQQHCPKPRGYQG
jgi:hypothetical protein